MKTKMLYVAFDGEDFETAEACAEYEVRNRRFRMVGLTREELDAAFAYEDPELADVIEAAGREVAKTRRNKGRMKKVGFMSAATIAEIAMAKAAEFTDSEREADIQRDEDGAGEAMQARKDAEDEAEE